MEHLLRLLEHTRQHPKYGCMAAAYFACTKDPRFLDHKTEVQQYRFAAIATTYGYCTYSLWDGAGKVDAPRDVSEFFWDCLDEGKFWCFIATVPSSTLKVALHSVAIAVIRINNTISFTVSDSQKETKQHFTKLQFLESRYSKIYELIVIEKIEVILAEPARTEEEVLAHLNKIEEGL